LSGDVVPLRRGQDGTTECWHHGDEVVDQTTFRVCFECGHAWTADALLAEFPRFSWDEDPAKVPFCPECLHDW